MRMRVLFLQLLKQRFRENMFIPMFYYEAYTYNAHLDTTCHLKPHIYINLYIYIGVSTSLHTLRHTLQIKNRNL